MKFKVDRNALYSLASSVSKVISSKNSLTILNNFLFEVTEETLVVKASDGDNTLVGSIAVLESESTGIFCCDARRMVDMLKELPAEPISFTIDDETLEMHVEYNNGFYTSMAINGAEYPETQKLSDGDPDALRFTLPMSVISAGIENTLFAVGNEDGHAQLSGILWDIKNDQSIFVATDTRKLVRYNDRNAAPGVECSFILPVKPAHILKNVFASQESVSILLNERTARFEGADFSFECQLIKGKYPAYDKVIPKNNTLEMTIDREAFLAAVRRVNSFVDANNGRVTFHITADKVEMKAQDSSYNTSGREEVGCIFNSQEMNIAFSGPYLMEILATLHSPEITAQLADPSRAAVILPSENAENTELLMLLMPMYVQEF